MNPILSGFLQDMLTQNKKNNPKPPFSQSKMSVSFRFLKHQQKTCFVKSFHCLSAEVGRHSAYFVFHAILHSQIGQSFKTHTCTQNNVCYRIVNLEFFLASLCSSLNVVYKGRSNLNKKFFFQWVCVYKIWYSTYILTNCQIVL